MLSLDASEPSVLNVQLFLNLVTAVRCHDRVMCKEVIITVMELKEPWMNTFNYSLNSEGRLSPVTQAYIPKRRTLIQVHSPKFIPILFIELSHDALFLNKRI